MSDSKPRPSSYKDQYAAQSNAALYQLLDWCGGSWAQMARVLEVHYQAVMGFKAKGRVGARVAARIGRNRKIPFTREQMRPDIKDWSVWAPQTAQLQAGRDEGQTQRS